MHPLLAEFDKLDTAIGVCPELSMPQQHSLRTTLSALKRDAGGMLRAPKPGDKTIDAGATITHRPDLVHDERVRQAAMQGDAERGGYLPVREQLRKGAE